MTVIVDKVVLERLFETFCIVLALAEMVTDAEMLAATLGIAPPECPHIGETHSHHLPPRRV